MLSRRQIGLRLSLVVTVGLIAWLLIWHGTSEPPDESLLRVQRSGQLVVGVDPSYPPFEYLGPGDDLKGFDVELATALAHSLGVEPSFVSLDIGSLFEAVIAGKLDVAISCLAPAPEYSEQLSYSRAYFNAGQVIVVRGEAEALSRPESLVGRKVGVEASSEGEIKLREMTTEIGDLEVKPYSTQEALFEALERGEVNVVVVDRVSAMMHTDAEDGILLGSPITDDPFVVVSRRADASLTAALDQALSELIDSGYLADLEMKWLR